MKSLNLFAIVILASLARLRDARRTREVILPMSLPISGKWTSRPLFQGNRTASSIVAQLKSGQMDLTQLLIQGPSPKNTNRVKSV